jgi:hypothetical protein
MLERMESLIDVLPVAEQVCGFLMESSRPEKLFLLLRLTVFSGRPGFEEKLFLFICTGNRL